MKSQQLIWKTTNPYLPDRVEFKHRFVKFFLKQTLQFSEIHFFYLFFVHENISETTLKTRFWVLFLLLPWMPKGLKTENLFGSRSISVWFISEFNQLQFFCLKVQTNFNPFLSSLFSGERFKRYLVLLLQNRAVGRS